MHPIKLKDKVFVPFISNDKIIVGIQQLAQKINSDLLHESPLFIVVLNGAFMFAADLLKEVTIPCEISFIKLASYEGANSTGKISELIGLSDDINGRTVVIIEDIVDTGNTIEHIIALLVSKEVKKIKIATLLFKQESYKKNMTIDYVGFNIPNKFVVGYGLDYDNLGRNLKEIYIQE